VVMYAGRKVEEASVAALFARPSHPYTRGLMDCLPARAHRGADGHRVVKAIPGTVASALAIHDGCRFGPRCEHAADACRAAMPGLELAESEHLTRCIRWRSL